MVKQVEQEVFHLMRQIFQLHTAQWQHEQPQLTKPQFAVMSTVDAHPGIEQALLTKAAVSTKATLAELLSRLEKRRLVIRQQDSEDKRRRQVYLTAEGRRLLNEARPLATQVDDRFLDLLTADEQQELSRLLCKLRDKAESGD